MAVVLVTGSSTGIGQATALRLARDGNHVFASMRNPEGGTPLIEAREREDLELELIGLDVVDAASCEAAVAEIEGRAGRLDVLVNNAGISMLRAIEETSDEEWQGMFATNFFGPMRLTRLALPGMRARGEGAIVNVTSVAGRMASSPQGAYAASKFALEAASEVLAQEVRPLGIRVAVIEPGVTQTPIFTKGDLVLDESSPYIDSVYRAVRMFSARLADPSPPELVADVISSVLTAEDAPFRHPVGDDAGKWIAGRAALSDEDWVDVGRAMSLDEYAAQHAEIFGIEI